MPRKKASIVSIGHNSGTMDKLIKSFVERFENLDKDKDALNDDFKQLAAEAKDSGLNVKAIKIIVRERKMEIEKREELELALIQYRSALGMLSGTELGEAALKRENETGDAGDKEDEDGNPRGRT